MRKSVVLTGLLVSISGVLFAASTPTTPAASGRTQPQPMPRYFEANQGQWTAGEAYRAYGYGYAISLRKNGLVLEVAGPGTANSARRITPTARPGIAPTATPPREVSLSFEGSDSAVELTGLDALHAKGAWFEGTQTEWRSEIPLYERVRASQIYPGVDATYYGSDGQFEYDLNLAPGARAGALVLDLDGADHAAIDKGGDLTIEANGQKIVLHKPLAWQPNGASRKPVEVSYVSLPSNGRSGQRIGLRMKGYDASKALTIDPVLTFATYLISTTSSLPDYYVVNLALDSSNNIYVLSTDQSGVSMTVQKLTPAGALVYTATFSSKSGNQYPAAMRVSASGQAYIASTATAGYPTTTTAYQAAFPNKSYGNQYNAALSVISADGSSLVYSTYFGGTANGTYAADYGFAVAVDGSGNAYVSGQAGGGGFPTTAGAYQTTYTGGHPASFVAKFNPSASGTASLVYSTLVGGQYTYSNNMTVDSAGDAYLALFSASCNVPTTSGAFAYSGLGTGSNCGYITAVNPTGTALDYSAYIGPGQPLAIAVDSSQNAYAVGDYIQAEDFPTTSGAYQTSYPDGFAMELNPTGGMIYSTFLSGPSGGSRPNHVAPDSIALAPGCSSACSAFIAGQTEAADFPLISALNGPPPVVGPGTWEPFLVELNGTGSAALTSGYLSGLSSSQNQAVPVIAFLPTVAVDSFGNAWLAGTLTGTGTSDFPVTTSTAPGSDGAWLAEVSMANEGNVVAVPNSVAFGNGIPVDVSSTVYDTANSVNPTTIALRNMGSAPVTLSSIVASPSVFTESDNCNGQIAASSYCTATIVFTPATDAPVTGTLTITSNGLNNSLTIPLSGQGMDSGFIEVSPAVLNFGNQTINTTSSPQILTVTNVGDEAAPNANIFDVSPPDGFSVITNCPATLPPGNTCQAEVTFAPNQNQVGALSTTLYANYYATYVTLNGTGVLPSADGGTQSFALSGTTLNFGAEPIGTASTQQDEYITNTGSLPVGLLPPTITLTSAQGSAADFEISNANTTVLNVLPQVYDEASITFTPSAAATETATLTYPVAGSSTPVTINLVGQGMADTQVLEFQPGNVIFPDQPVGVASALQSIYVVNTGNTPFLVDRVIASGDFSVTGGTCPGFNLLGTGTPGLVNYSYCSVNVVFTPSQTGSRTGTLTVYDAATGSPQTIPLAGNGLAAAGVFSVDPTQLDFGAQVKGTSSAAQYVTLSNSGDIYVNLTNVATTGDYAITYNNCGSLPYAIPPGSSSCYLSVTFTPTVTTTPDNGTLTLTTSAGTQTVTLTGGGETGTLASGLSPTSIAFGSFPVTGITTPVPVYVRNSGTETLKFTAAATVTGNYSLSDACGTSSLATRAPGQDCYIYVSFSPTATGTRNGTLTVKSNAGTLTASLTGTGVAATATPTYFSPAAISFDQQAVNSMSPFSTVSFTYGGTTTGFSLTGASITAGSANFQLASGVNALNTCFASQGSTTSCQVNVVFSPTAAGYQTGTLTVTSTLGSYPVTLSGYAPIASDTGYLDPSALSFPSQVVSTVSVGQQVYLYNTGAAAFTVGTVGGTNVGSAAEFEIQTDQCSGQVMAATDSQTANGGSCYVNVEFAPSASGSRTGTLSIPVTYSDGTTGTFTASLTGIGTAQDNEAVLSPTVLTFPDTALGIVNTFWEYPITLTNSGNLPFTVGQLTGTNTVIGSSKTGDFTAASPGGSDGCSGESIPPGSNCAVEVSFQPSSAGARTGTIVFPVTYANATTPTLLTATLAGNGVTSNPAITISPAGIQFDTVTVNAGVSSNYQTFLVTNTGNVPVTISKSTLPTGFSFENDGCTGISIAPGSSCTDYVYFNPTTTGVFTGTLSLTDTAAGSPQSVVLSGTSLAASSELEFSQTTVSFGSQVLKTSSNSLTIYLVNSGSKNVTVHTLTLSGTNPANFGESDSCAGTTLYANSSCAIYLTFTPNATGSRVATLTESDSGSGGPRTINLSGFGTNASTAVVLFPAALTFSPQDEGEGSAQQFFSVTNVGANSVTISGVASTDPTDFPVAQDGCTGTALTTGSSCLIDVRFTPASAANLSAFINVTDNASGSPQQLPVAGTGATALTSSTTLTATPTSGAFGSLFTLVAAVQDQNSNPVTNGSVTFYDGATVLGTAQVVSTTSGGSTVGTATLKTILVPLGSNSITARYAGADVSSTSAPAVVTVTGMYPTTTTFASSGSAGDYTFTGTVVGAGPVNPTGSVTFTDNTTTLVPGTASIESSTLAQTFVAAPAAGGLNAQLAVAAADLNGDGIPDLVSGSASGLTVQLGNGDGTFGAPTTVTSGSVSSYGWANQVAGNSIAFGDFNSDGKVDIAFIECTGSATSCAVGILLGNGDGTFQKERYYDPETVIGGIAVGDFNGDGIPDIAATDAYNQTVDLLLGNGDGTFQAPLYIGSVYYPYSIAAGDVNGDGVPDLVVAEWNQQTVNVFFGNGNGTFQAAQSYSTAAASGSAQSNVTLADLRGIGKLDIVFLDQAPGVGVLLNNGNGTYGSATEVYSPASPSALTYLAVADMNGDGKPDLIVTDSGRIEASVLLGNGDGTFQAPNSYPTGATPLGVFVTDLNHDGRPDIVVANSGGTTDTILLNQVSQTATLTNAVVPGTGTHSVSGAYSGDANFAPSTSNALQLAASLVTPSMQLAAEPSASVMWGQALSVGVTLTGPLSFVPAPTGTATYSIDGGTPQTAGLVAGAVTIPISQLSVGSHSIAVSYGGDQYYTTLAAQSLAVTITKANQTITFNPLPNVTYGVSPITLSASSTSGLPVAFAVTSGPASITNGVMTITGVGAVTVTATQGGNVDYNPATGVPQPFTVAQATLTVTVNPATKVYGAALPTFTSSIIGLVNGDTVTVTYSTTATAASAVGSYAVTPGISGTAAANYTLNPQNGTLTITAATLKVTANNASRAYGAANPIFTDTITGFVNGDTQSVVSGAASLTTTATTTSVLGTYPITAALGTLSATNYTFTFANGTLTVNQATPSITWATPAAITYGTALSSTQLDATSPVAGTFVYTPTAGTVLGAGSQTLSVTFTPTDTTDYKSPTTTVQLTVNKATPVVNWPVPSPIAYGTALSGTQLDATSPVAGAFVYSPAAGKVLTAGAHTLTVTFTPTDGTDYKPGYTTVSLTVNQATPSITWATPAAINYGTALSATQLDATSTVAGSFSYSPGAGTVPGAGSQTLSATFTPTDTTDYSTAQATVTLTVNQGTPTVTWPPPAAITYGTALSATQLDATSTVAGSFAYSPAAGTVLGAGTQTLSVTFTPTDGTDYKPVTTTVQLTVNRATPIVTWPTPAAITYGTGLSATQLDATANTAGTFAYSPAAGSVLGAGTQTLSATFTPTDGTDYTTATGGTTLTVNKATPSITWTNPAAIAYGTALSGTQLDATSTVAGSFAYSPAAGTVLGAGAQTLTTTFTPTDAVDYNTATGSATLTVTKATLLVTATNATRAYDVANPTFSDMITGFVNGDTQNVVSGAAALSTTATTTSNVGKYPITAALGTLSAANYSFTFASGTLTVIQATPAITWNPPSAIIYGKALGATQLDASSKVAGTFTYSPAAGTVLGAGVQQLCLTFTPTNTTDYTSPTVCVLITVNQAAPVITWATPTAITYGTALSSTQLDATSSVAGTFAYSPGLGTVLDAGTQTLSATFTPTDTTDYKTVTPKVSLVVKPAATTITWPTPAAITYGTALSATQLDATANVPGTFVYTPAAGTVLKAPSHSLSVTFTPTDKTDYKTATATVTLTINPATPTINWATPAPITYGTKLSATQLDATSPVAGTFAYSPGSGTELAPGAQTLSVTLSPTDTTDYTTATASVILTVNKVVPTITWATPAAIKYGKAIGATQLNATASVAGTFAYSPVSGTVPGAGPQTLSVTFTPTNSTDYAVATDSVTLTVTPATLTVTAKNAPRVYGAANPTFTDTIAGFVNGDTQSVVSGAASITTTATVTSPVGTYPITPALGTLAAANYTFTFVNGTLTVSKATPVIAWATPSPITYGTALSATQLDATSSVPGTFVYTPAAGTVLKAPSHTLSVTFTPTDTADYLDATATVTLTINPATPIITWATPTPIAFGTALSATQLDATTPVAGTLTYNPIKGTIPPVGNDTLTVSFAPTDTTDYTTATDSVVLVVEPNPAATPVFTPPAGTYTGTQAVTINDSTTGSSVYYTTDGTAPSTSSPLYTAGQQITVTSTEKIQAIAVATANGFTQSATATATYTLNLPAAAAPAVSPASGTYSSAQTVSILPGATGSTIYYTLDGTYPTTSSPVYTGSFMVSAPTTVTAVAAGPGFALSPYATSELLFSGAATPDNLIYTVAGTSGEGYTGDGGKAPLAEFNTVQNVVRDSAGNVYVSDSGNNRIRKIAVSSGTITTYAGTGVAGYSGDTGQATSAEINSPWGMAVDSSGNLYFADYGNSRIRKITASTGVITTVQTATDEYPIGIAFDSSGNLYFSSQGCNCIEKIAEPAGTVTTVAGNGTWGYNGDGGPAVSAAFRYPYGIAIDGSNNLYIADSENQVIRKINATTKNISTVAGNGTDAGDYIGAYGGDGGPATSAELSQPEDVAVDGSGNIYIADMWNYRIREVAASTGKISTFAGDGLGCYSAVGDGNPATEVGLCYPGGVWVNSAGNAVYIANTYSGTVREVTSASTPPTTAAASPAFSVAAGSYSSPQTVTISDPTAGGAAIYITLNGTTPTTTSQQYFGPINVTGSVTISAVSISPAHVLSPVVSKAYKITSAPASIISTFAGSGLYGFSGFGGAATNAAMGYPTGVAFDAAGDLYVADAANSAVWKIAAKTGTATVVAGTGVAGYSGDGGLAVNAQLNDPYGLGVDGAGNLYIADSGNLRVREVSASSGLISTVAGNGAYGDTGDSGPATSASIGGVQAIAVDAAGDVFIAQNGPDVVRKVVAATGVISTIAGNTSSYSDSGDGGAATSAGLAYPYGLALDGAGNVYIGEVARVRKVTVSSGIISTVAGIGNYGYSGDGGSALTAQLGVQPVGLAVDTAGDIYLSNGAAIREVSASTGNISTVAGNGYFGYWGDGGSATIAGISSIFGIALDSAGNLYLADYSNSRVRKVVP